MTNARVIDVTTGEDLSADYTLRHRNQDVAFRSKVGTDRRHFAFAHMQYIKEVTPELSNTYCGYTLMLQPYIEWQTNVIVDAQQTPMERKAIAKVLGVSQRTADTVIKQLKDADILRDSDGVFRINERYHFRKKAGDQASVLIKVFSTTLKRHATIKPADLGFLYKLLPYVHYESNIICDSALVKSGEPVKFLNERQIAEVVGMEAKKASATLDRLRKSGIIGTWLGDDKRERLTVLNPYVFFRKNGYPDGTLRSLFEATEK